jgi:hypothetical protein
MPIGIGTATAAARWLDRALDAPKQQCNHSGITDALMFIDAIAKNASIISLAETDARGPAAVAALSERLNAVSQTPWPAAPYTVCNLVGDVIEACSHVHAVASEVEWAMHAAVKEISDAMDSVGIDVSSADAMDGATITAAAVAVDAMDAHGV